MSKDGYLTPEEKAPPLSSRVLRLHLQPAARLTWVGAGWAAMCGIIAAGVSILDFDMGVRALLTLVLADPVLGSVWNSFFGVRDFALTAELDEKYSRDGPVMDGGDSLDPCAVKTPSLPTAQTSDEHEPATEAPALEREPSAPGLSTDAGLDGDKPEARDQLETDLLSSAQALPDQSRQWWTALTVTHRQQIVNVCLLYGLSLLIALALGRGVAVVVGLGLVLPLIAWFALGEYPLRDGWTRAVLEIGLSWAVGVAAFTALPVTSLDGISGVALSTLRWASEHLAALGIGLFFVIAYYGKLSLNRWCCSTRQQALLNLPQIVVVLLLAVWHQPILAGTAAILVLAQVLFQPYLRQNRARWYLRSTQWMFMGVMLVAAIGLATHSL